MTFDPDSDLQIFDPEITEAITRHREMHQNSFDGLIMSIYQKDIVNAIDFYTEMVTDSLSLFSFIADHTKDSDPYSEWAEIATKELQNKNDEAKQYLHNFLEKSGLHLERETITPLQAKKFKDPEYRKKQDRLAKEAFENWKETDYTKDEIVEETDEEFIKNIEEHNAQNEPDFGVDTDDEEFSDDDTL